MNENTLTEVRYQLGRYIREVEETDLSISTKQTYTYHARSFVRWMEGEFTPGSHGRRMPTPRRREA